MNIHAAPPVEERPFILVLMVAVLFAATVFAGVLVIGKGGTAAISGGAGPGSPPVVSVPEALAAAPDTPLLVSGVLFVSGDGTVYLTDALLESYPPQIDAGRALRIDGLDLDAVTGLQHAGDVSWTRSAVELGGTVTAGILTVAG